MNNNRLRVKLPGLDLKNPVMPASGTFGFGDIPAAEKFDLNELGAMVVKTTTKEARSGNPQPQIWVGDKEVINAVGLANPGVEVVANEKLVNLKNKYPDLPIIGSIGGSTIDDYRYVTKILSESEIPAALELNISCPNVKEGGQAFGTNPEIAAELTKAVKEETDLPVYVKLSPNVTDISAIAKAVEEAGADGLTLINTVLGLRINLKERRPVVRNVTGGLSGKPIQALALRMVYEVSQVVDIPIIGVGGIFDACDVLEMFLAGASAVQVGTAHFYNSLACPDIIKDLPKQMDKYGFSTLEDLRKNVHARQKRIAK